MKSTENPGVRPPPPEVMPDLSHCNTGDLVVGSFDAAGKPTGRPSGFVGDATTLAQRYAEVSMMVKGAALAPTTVPTPQPTQEVKKPKKTKKRSEPQAALTMPVMAPLPAAVVGRITELAPNASVTAPQVEVNYMPKKIVDSPKYGVTLLNDFGRISMKALDVYECPMAFGLLFENADAMSFVPKRGQHITLEIKDIETGASHEHMVFFPDIIFTTPNGNKLMVVLRVPEEDEETETVEE